MKIQSKIVVGFDLGNLVSQLSYCILGEDEPVTLTMAGANEGKNITNVIAKRKGVNQWFYGMEAIEKAESNEAILVEDIYRKAILDEMITIDNNSYSFRELLKIFVSKIFDTVRNVISYEQIELFVISVEELNQNVIKLLNKVVEELPIKSDKIIFQSKEESVFHYIVNMPSNIYDSRVLLVDGTDDFINTFVLNINKTVRPMIAHIDKVEYPYLEINNIPAAEQALLKFQEEFDNNLLIIVRALLEKNTFSTIYFMGDIFVNEKFKNTIRHIGGTSRIFVGNNLFSKGACYLAKDKLQKEKFDERYCFLGNDKLKTNIYLIAKVEGEVKKFPLVSAGLNWYEVDEEIDFMLGEENEIEIYTNSLTELAEKKFTMTLDGLPRRPQYTTRIRIKLSMVTENVLSIIVEDMGFGDIYKSTNKVWNMEEDIL